MQATCKLSPQRQISVPKRVWEACDRPTHFRLQLVDDPASGEKVLFLWPGRVVSLAQQAERAGLPLDVVREARRIVEERTRAGEAAHASPPGSAA